MALNEVACRLLKPYFKGRVLCLGVPIVLLSPMDCEEIFGIKPRKFVKGPDWAKGEMPDPYALAEDLGVELTCVDAIAHDGRELIADLNYPHDLGEFDLVLDAGTTEHCFNVAQAITNTVNAVKVGGWVLHTNPISMGNHAFYNFCPTLFWDFYRANGFKVEHMSVRDRNGGGELVKFHPTNRFPLGNNWAVYCLAKRVEKKPLTYPIQSKYL